MTEPVVAGAEPVALEVEPAANVVDAVNAVAPRSHSHQHLH